MVCSEYLTNGGVDNGVCKLFATACTTDPDCYSRVPGTACNLTATTPYCYLPERARVDTYAVDRDSGVNVLDVLANDSFGDGICTGDDTGVISVTASFYGGTVAVSASGRSVDYTPPPGICGVTDLFSYTADLGADARSGDPDHTADVFVFIACVCGNGVVNPGEDCDDGGTTPGDGCDARCHFEPVCGNSRLDPGEQCDDGNTSPGDGCSPTCQSESRCGDGQVGGAETCDDGNTVSGDGCRGNCTLENVCGDGLVDSQEQCDDGNTSPGDGCDGSCRIEAAGCVTDSDCQMPLVCFFGTCVLF
ncbi:MAG: DUF4215 domain-containing protein [Deltaproteobacteria bacterium]|nr:DUF4215 domain-containing protein [Deltaproteobacteria bacterium]